MTRSILFFIGALALAAAPSSGRAHAGPAETAQSEGGAGAALAPLTQERLNPGETASLLRLMQASADPRLRANLQKLRSDNAAPVCARTSFEYFRRSFAASGELSSFRIVAQCLLSSSATVRTQSLTIMAFATRNGIELDTSFFNRP